MHNDYRFETVWHFEAQVADITDILFDVAATASWWTPVCLTSKMLEPGDDLFIGLRAEMLTRGRLPYQMHWELLVTEHEPLRRVVLQLLGDAVGHAEWRFKQKGSVAEIELEWSLRAEHPLLRKFSRPLRPAFEYNHAWSMQQGQCGLCAELKRRARLRDERPNAYWGI